MSTVLPDPSALEPSAVDQLRAQVEGDVHVPGEPAYDEARLPWNRASS